MRTVSDSTVNWMRILVTDAHIALVGLLAVNDNFKGKRIGQHLIHATLMQVKRWGCKQLKIQTQKRNSAACGFYESNDFKVAEEANVYHWWRK